MSARGIKAHATPWDQGDGLSRFTWDVMSPRWQCQQSGAVVYLWITHVSPWDQGDGLSRFTWDVMSLR